MKMLYLILAIAGWVWLMVLFGYLWYCTTWCRKARKEPRGFEVQPTERKD